ATFSKTTFNALSSCLTYPHSLYNDIFDFHRHRHRRSSQCLRTDASHATFQLIPLTHFLGVDPNGSMVRSAREDLQAVTAATQQYVQHRFPASTLEPKK
ncbi:hypothetical protein EDC04DRAFT_2500473, partial [Pisolithus marmoratus]